MHDLLQAALARKLDRISAAYAVAGWLLVQAASIVLPAFDAPAWALRALIVAAVIGFPLALTIAWFAVRPDPTADAAPIDVSHREVVLLALLCVVLLLSLGELAFVIWRAPQAPRPGPNAPAEASIAVLAFNNMSDDPKNAYFSDGISEELLNDLSQVRGLRVAGRTSSFSFRGRSVTIGAIGKALNVHTVLEGSVQRVGDRVRITAQLINAADDFHMWSQSYDREIADIFAVEDEISHAITRELTGRLLPGRASGQPAPAKPKIDPAAYTAYLQGRFFMNKRNKDDMLRAADFFKQAIRLAPDYANAHAALGATYAHMYYNGQSRSALPGAEDETAAALRLAPGNFEATLIRGKLAVAKWNWSEADSVLRHALDRNPNSAEAHHTYALLLSALNFSEAAAGQWRLAATLDPLAPLYRANLGSVLSDLNRDAEAAVEERTALTLDPNSGFARISLCEVLADMGKLEEARKMLDALVVSDGNDGPDTDSCRVSIAWRSGDRRELKRLAVVAERQYATGDATASTVAWAYAGAEQVRPAIHWFERAYDERDVGLLDYANARQLPLKIKEDPRWKELMQRPLMRETQAAHDHIAAELASGR
jgi:serine/threonine-protein kinase